MLNEMGIKPPDRILVGVLPKSTLEYIEITEIV